MFFAGSPVMKRDFCVIVQTILVVIFSAFGQSDSVPSNITQDQKQTTDSIKSECLPEITISYDNVTQVFCLNQFTPGGDSCADLEINYQDRFGLKVRFRCNYMHRWLFDSVVYVDPAAMSMPVNASISSDQDGYLARMQLYLGKKNDSSALDIKIERVTDIPNLKPDSTPPVPDNSVQKVTYSCVQRPMKAVLIEKVFTYPVNYMRKEPIYNYPELKMFHVGSSVKMPSSESIRMRGILINEYKVINNLPELDYSEQSKPMRGERVESVKKEKKQSFFNFKSLRE